MHYTKQQLSKGISYWTGSRNCRVWLISRHFKCIERKRWWQYKRRPPLTWPEDNLLSLFDLYLVLYLWLLLKAQGFLWEQITFFLKQNYLKHILMIYA
jgi:hypothetical protein